MKYKFPMFRDRPTNKSKRQSGSALVIAIFVIVVMSLLGSALVRMISAEAETIAYEVLGTRAFQAAQTGLQRKLSELFPLSPAAGVCNVIPETFDLSTIEGLKNCKVESAVCGADAIVNGVAYYTVRSEGQCEVAGIITSRTLEVKARTL